MFTVLSPQSRQVHYTSTALSGLLDPTILAQLFFKDLYKNRNAAAKSKAFRLLEGFVDEAL